MNICLISEGSYPVVRGGVSEWTHQLIESLPLVEFGVFCIAPLGQNHSIYHPHANTKYVAIHELGDGVCSKKIPRLPQEASSALSACLGGVLYGNTIDCAALAAVMKQYPVLKGWLNSTEYWDTITRAYQANCPEAKFTEYFWTAYGMFSMLLECVSFARQIPIASAYHTLTSGLAGLLGCLAKTLNGRPLIVSEHGIYLKEREIDLSRQNMSPAARLQITNFYKAIVLTAYENADVLMPICETHAQMEIKLGARPERIRVVTNGIDSHKFFPAVSGNGGTPTVGNFARVVPVKDQKNLIRAARMVLDDADVKFVIVGEIQDQQYYGECRALATELGISENVKFVGHSNDVVKWYHETDVFVLSSQSEGVPLALLEAMSCGLPSVCTAVGGVPGILSDSRVGFVVPPSDPGSLAHCIGELVRNPELRKSMGALSRHLIEDRHTTATMAKRILEVYVDLHVKGS